MPVQKWPSTERMSCGAGKCGAEPSIDVFR
jgi:hypothetical protein